MSRIEDLNGKLVTYQDSLEGNVRQRLLDSEGVVEGLSHRVRESLLELQVT